MNNIDLIKVDIVPFGADTWKSMGTEYESSFTAFKEIIDNSVSAAGENRCKILIKLQEQIDDSIKVIVEDCSGGVSDPGILLRISSDSAKKQGAHNIYGHGLKHALAFFNSNHSTSNWVIQSRTNHLMEESKILQVRAPYLYPHENNELFGHEGMNVVYLSEDDWKGEKYEAGTLVEFTTPRQVFAKMNPLKTSGAPISKISSIAEELSNLCSLFYLPLLRKNVLDIEIKFSEADGKNKFKSINVQKLEIPSIYTIGEKEFVNQKVPTKNGGFMKMKIKWVQINRNNPHPFIYPQKYGLLCYVNGILADPYTYIDQVLGGYEDHPSLNSVVCIVEAEGLKKDVPELSVSKTKFRTNGENYLTMINYISDICPKSDLQDFVQRNNTSNETVLRHRRYEMLKGTLKEFVQLIEEEYPCTLPDDTKAGDNMRYDIVYKNVNDKVFIEEFKKDTVKPDAVAQIIQYGELAKHQFSSNNIEMTLVGKKCSHTAQKLIEYYCGIGYILKFQSFADLHIPHE